jgi:hypothetical protein
MTGPSPYMMAAFILETILDLSEDEKRFLNETKENMYWGSPMSARKLHDLTVLFYQAEGFHRATSHYDEMGDIE